MRRTLQSILIGLLLALIVCQGCSGGHQTVTPEGVPLPEDMAQRLSQYEWNSRVGGNVGIWVSVADQRLYVIQSDSLLATYVCSTARAGTGSERDSGKTPLGWHRVAAKIGTDLPAGARLKDRQWTGAVWQPGQDTAGDLILSRILWLDGLEKGKNRGDGVDSKNRYIYIHGTNRLEDLGTPASHGCIRLNLMEIIQLYEMVPSKSYVLITEE